MRLPTLIGLLVAGLLSISFAHAQDLTAQQKLDALTQQGIFSGVGGSQPSQDQDMTRAQFARVAALLVGLDTTSGNVPTTIQFSDVSSNDWTAQGVTQAAAAGYLSGNGDGAFAPSTEMTLEQLARVLTETLGLPVEPDATVDGTASDWAQGYVAAVISAGLFPSSGDYTEGATRADLVAAAFDVQQSLGAGTPAATVGNTDQSAPGGSAPDLSGSMDFINQQSVLAPFAPIQPGTIAGLDQAVAALITPPDPGLDGSASVLPTQIAMAENNTGNEVMMDELLQQAIERQNNGTLTGFYAGGFTGDGGAVGGTIQLSAELGGGSGMFDGWMDFTKGGSGRVELLGIGAGSGVFSHSVSPPSGSVFIHDQSVDSVYINGAFSGSDAIGGWEANGSSIAVDGEFSAIYR